MPRPSNMLTYCVLQSKIISPGTFNSSSLYTFRSSIYISDSLTTKINNARVSLLSNQTSISCPGLTTWHPTQDVHDLTSFASLIQESYNSHILYSQSSLTWTRTLPLFILSKAYRIPFHHPGQKLY